MAYKFQRGEAVFSGSIELQDSVAELSISAHDGTKGVELAKAGTLSGSSDLSIGGSFRAQHMAGIGTIVPADDGIMLYDASANGGVGEMAKQSFTTFLQAIDGAALGVNSNQLKVNVDDSSIQVNGSDNLEIKTAGVTLAMHANMAANTVLVRDANDAGVPTAKAVTNQQILIGDGTGFTAAALSGDVTMTNAGVVSIGANVIDGAAGGGMLNTGLVHSQTAMTGAIQSVDKLLFSDHTETANRLRSLSIEVLGKEMLAAAVAAAPATGSADTLVFLDATDVNVTKKTSIVQFLDTIAGAGITANSDGTISADGASAPATVTDGAYTLAEGYNYYSGSASKTVLLPASPSTGDVFYVKDLGNLGAGNSIKITGSSDAVLIDGRAFVNLESDYGAVGFVYLNVNNWGII